VQHFGRVKILLEGENSEQENDFTGERGLCTVMTRLPFEFPDKGESSFQVAKLLKTINWNGDAGAILV